MRTPIGEVKTSGVAQAGEFLVYRSRFFFLPQFWNASRGEASAICVARALTRAVEKACRRIAPPSGNVGQVSCFGRVPTPVPQEVFARVFSVAQRLMCEFVCDFV